jgi:hypothetical protein
MVKMPVWSEGEVIGLKNLALTPNPNRLPNLYPLPYLLSIGW